MIIMIPFLLRQPQLRPKGSYMVRSRAVPKFVLFHALLVCGGCWIDSTTAAAFAASGNGGTPAFIDRMASALVAPHRCNTGIASSSLSRTTIMRRKYARPRKFATTISSSSSTQLLSAVSFLPDDVPLSLDLSDLQEQFLNVVVGPIGTILPDSLKEYDVAVSLAAVGLLLPGALVWLSGAATPEKLLSDSTRAKILTGTFLGDGKVLDKVYKASRDGWSALAFHEAVDGAGSGLVVVRGRNGKVFGGYNPSGWRSTDDYSISSAAFLWCLAGQSSVIKCPILPGGNCAIFDYATAGPTFGSNDFCVGPPRAAIMGGFAGPDSEDMTMAAGNLRQCRSNIGTSYRNHPAWPARGSMQLVEVEVYCAAGR